jgi:hypothetical protein
MKNDMDYMSNMYGAMEKPKLPKGWEIKINRLGENALDDPSCIDGIVFALESESKGKKIYLQHHVIPFNGSGTKSWYAAYCLSLSTKPTEPEPLRHIIASPDFGVRYCCEAAAKYNDNQQ